MNPNTQREGAELEQSGRKPGNYQSYADARLKQGIRAARIDREFDLISQVVRWAMLLD
jgi:hypothetical protein